MRWYWIDRFLEFESGRFARAVKNVSLAEDYLHDHFPGYPVLPHALVVEGIAQTGGLLVCEYNQFSEKVVLAKVLGAKFHSEVLPGESLVYTATLESINQDGAVVTGTSYKGDQLQAEMQLVFAHINNEHLKSLFDPETFLRMMRILGAFEVGRAADGSPLVPPQKLLISSNGQ